VERKPSFRENVPGVVVVTCKSKEWRDKVLKEKRKLKASSEYSNVYVQGDKPRKERQYEANLRLLVGALAKDTLEVPGDRLCKKQTRPNMNNSGGTGRGGRGRGGYHGRGHGHPTGDRRVTETTHPQQAQQQQTGPQ